MPVCTPPNNAAYGLEVLAAGLEDIRDLTAALVVPQRGLDELPPADAACLLGARLANVPTHLVPLEGLPDDPARAVYALLGELSHASCRQETTGASTSRTVTSRYSDALEH